MAEEKKITAVARVESFGSSEIAQHQSGTSNALAARATAEVQARYIVANNKPRNIEKVRGRLLDYCSQLGFAEIANYARPVGKKNGEEQYAEGASVHLIRTALQLYGNCSLTTTPIDDTPETQTVQVEAIDHETNFSLTRSFVVEKTTEKRGEGPKGANPPKGRDTISSRLNSYGDMVWLCRATPDEILMRVANMGAKIERTLGEKLLPRDLVQAARFACYETVAKQIDSDPKAAMRQILDTFRTELRVQADQLEQLLGHSLETIAPAEIALLRRIFLSIRDGETTIAELLDSANAAGSPEAADQAKAGILQSLRKKAAADVKPQPQQGKDQSAKDDAPNDKDTPKDEKKPQPDAEPQQQQQQHETSGFAKKTRWQV